MVEQVDISAKRGQQGRLSRATISRRGLVAGLLAGAVAHPLWAEAPLTSPHPMPRPGSAGPGSAGPGSARTGSTGPAAAADKLVQAAKLGGVVAYAVADLSTGAILESAGADTAVPPASVAKTVTTLYALEKLGADHRFQTRLMRLGPVIKGRLEGDLILAGGGDPTLDTDRLGDLAAALAATGLREVTGRFIAYAGALPGRDSIAPDQPDHVGYDPAISGLNLNFNRVYFEWKQQGDGWATGMDARGARFLPKVFMADVGIAQRDLPIFAYTAAEGRDRWSVAASALGKEGSRWLPVRHPAEYTAEVFQTLCAAHGIHLKSAEILQILPAGAVEIAKDQSAPLSKVLRDMLKYSTNMTAEIVGLAASGAGSQQWSAAAMREWARVRFGFTGWLVDHSGLGADNRVTADDLVRMMLAADHNPAAARLMGLLHETGLADVDGKPSKISPVRILAKTGTLNFVSALSGYVIPSKGRKMAFAILTADVPRREALAINERENPPGGSAWVKRSRRLQQQLIRRWVTQFT
ncbi:MAG: D-alanyl-D-alanine carboxypeptidase/D-alanyl-D-alanine-endopeptidase [Cypionkella sp.]|nr:D-alanyl-D-alanine carboxypeptidase/D-alanyl-D-alanine-endopeptidase [Cypionkella sp.]